MNRKRQRPAPTPATRGPDGTALHDSAPLCRVLRDAAPLCRVLQDAAPAAEHLIGLLAPWDRARLRLTCRALSEQVPAAACAPTLAAMVRAPGGGAGLLRYGAGDARPCWVHALIAVEADAADALRWVLRRCPVDGDSYRAWELKRVALRMGSAAAWRVVAPLAARDRPEDALELARDAVLGGCESMVAECAAAAAASLPVSSATVVRDYLPHVCVLIDAAEERDMPAVLAPFLRLDGYARHARLAALRMGRRGLAEPYDWRAGFDAASLLRAALRGGDMAMVRSLPFPAPSLGMALLPCHALGCRRGAFAALEWLVSRLETDPVRETSLRLVRGMADDAIRWDSAEALRWLHERRDCALTAAMLQAACRADAIACIAYLVGAGLRPTADMLLGALRHRAYRAVAAVVHVGPLDVMTFVRLAIEISEGECRGVRVMALLRRHALRPAPGPAFLDVCLCSLNGTRQLHALAMAGYRVDADERTWLDSVRPHCADVPDRDWQPQATLLRHLWHTQCQGARIDRVLPL